MLSDCLLMWNHALSASWKTPLRPRPITIQFIELSEWKAHRHRCCLFLGAPDSASDKASTSEGSRVCLSACLEWSRFSISCDHHSTTHHFLKELRASNKLITVCVVSHSVTSDSVTPWTVACQAPLSMRFFRQEYWSGFLFPFLGDLLDTGIKPVSPALQANSLSLSHQGSPDYYVWETKQLQKTNET